MGAAAMLLSAEAWNKCTQTNRGKSLHLQNVPTSLISVDGSPLSIKGTTTIDLTSNQYSFHTPVIIVENLAEEAILGLDFLQGHNFTIDIPKRKLEFHSGSTPVCLYAKHSLAKPDVPLQAAVKETVVIPPFSELETLSMVDDFSGQCDTWLVEDMLSRKSINATVPRAIVSPNSEIVVRLINPSNTVYKGTHTTAVTKLPYENVLTVANISDFSSHTTTSKASLFHDIAHKCTALTNSEQNDFYSHLLCFL